MAENKSPGQAGKQKQQPAQQGQGAQALDWGSLLQKLQTFQQVAPILYEALQKVIEALTGPAPEGVRGQPGGKSLAQADHSCPDDYLCEVHDAAIAAQAEALALMIHCRCCCRPDGGG